MPVKTPPPVRSDDGWSIPSLREPRYSQSLERGLAILTTFTAARPVLGIADIADELGMSRSTTHRYVITLLELGYLEQGASRKYRLGLKVTDLGMSALNATGLREHADPHLEELRRRTSYTVGIGVLDGEDLLVVHQAASFRRGINSPLRTGSRAPAYATAGGKLLLAHLPDDDRAAMLRAMKPKRHGPNTILGKKTLADELDGLRDESVAVDDEEHAEGVLMLAAPVRNEARVVVAAIDVVVPAAAMSVGALVDALGPHVIATADQVSARLGYRRDDEQETVETPA